jgi:F-type H+-transporting ATPase subunit delta
MVNPKIASRYAKSLMDIATEKKAVEQTYNDALGLSKMFAQSVELCTLAKSPVIKADKKQAIFNALFGGKLNAITDLFIQLLIRKGREGALPDIMNSFIQQYKLAHKINTVKLTTAHPMDDTQKAMLTTKIGEQLPGMKVDLQTAVDESLIGGFVLESNNNLFDASVLRDLKDIKTQFTKNIYIPNIK